MELIIILSLLMQKKRSEIRIYWTQFRKIEELKNIARNKYRMKLSEFAKFLLIQAHAAATEADKKEPVDDLQRV